MLRLCLLVLMPLLAVAVTLDGSGARDPLGQKKTTAPPPKKEAPTATEKLYAKHCQLCHGDGNMPMPELNFADGKWARGSRVDDVVKSIRDGVPGTAMTAFKDILTAEEIRALAAHVRAFDKSLKTAKPRKPRD